MEIPCCHKGITPNPSRQNSMKICVVTPFTGVRVYTGSAMGMPGLETALEELTCRVLGDLLEEDIVVKMADDFYCGTDTLDKLQTVPHSSKQIQHQIISFKTVIAPRKTSVLKWI